MGNNDQSTSVSMETDKKPSVSMEVKCPHCERTFTANVSMETPEAHPKTR